MKIQAVDGGGDHVGPCMPGGRHSRRRIDQLHDHAAVDVARGIGILRFHQLGRNDSAFLDSLAFHLHPPRALRIDPGGLSLPRNRLFASHPRPVLCPRRSRKISPQRFRYDTFAPKRGRCQIRNAAPDRKSECKIPIDRQNQTCNTTALRKQASKIWHGVVRLPVRAGCSKMLRWKGTQNFLKTAAYRQIRRTRGFAARLAGAFL